MAKPAVEIKQEVVLELATLKLRRVSKRNCSSVKKNYDYKDESKDVKGKTERLNAINEI